MPTEDERFENFVARDPNSGCWIWAGCTENGGYGIFTRSAEHGSKPIMAHRYSYEQSVGEIPEGLVIDHLCRVRCCVNPNHLEPVTHKENLNRGINAKSEKTHCPQGHPYSGDNLYIRTDNGGRECKACIKARGLRYKEKRTTV